MLTILADWFGAGAAQGTPDSRKWYEANKDKMQLHPVTREWVEAMLSFPEVAKELGE